MSRRRRYYRKSATGSIISDTAFITSRLSWWGSLLFGLFSFIIFYFIVPSWLEAKMAEQSNNMFIPMLKAVFEKRIHWFEWLGIVCGLISIIFSLRSLIMTNEASSRERGIISMLARLIGRHID